MKTKKRPLINKKDMARLVSVARKKSQASEGPVQVQTLLKEQLPGRKITNQMRRLVSLKLDETGVPRVRKLDPAKPTFRAVALKAFSRKAKFKFERDQLAGGKLVDHAPEPLPGVLGGLGDDVIDVSFSEDLTEDMDEFLAEEVRNGNRRALRLLKSQIRRG